MRNSHPFLAAITASALLISPDSEALFQSSVQHLVASEHGNKMLDFAAANMATEDADFWGTGDDWKAAYRPYNVSADGTLQIPVMGVLLNRFPFAFGSYATGYAYIEKALNRGMADGNVKRIAFICASPGGEVAGCFELCDKIYDARGTKPMRAFSADAAYSAAYAIFSSADSGSVSRSGGVGSVGVVTAHVEYSKAMEAEGIKVTFIFAGKHKVDGNPYEKLPDAVKSRMSARINKIYGVFTSLVARNRDMDEEAVRATEALTYDAQEGIDVGFADRIGSLEDEMVIFSTDTTEEDDSDMANDNKEETVAKTVHESAVAAAVADGVKQGMAAQLGRIKGILGCANATSRPKAAMSFALNTDMTAEAANTVLADMVDETAATAAAVVEPKVEAAAEEDAFSKAMGLTPNPEVGATAGKTVDANSDEALSSSILADYAGSTGRKAA